MPRDPKDQLDQPAQTGPRTKRHWRNPDTLLDEAQAPVRRKGVAAPDVLVRRGEGDRLRIDYDLSARDPAPRALVVTVNSRNEKGVPPITHTFDEVARKPKGTIATEIPLHPARHYDVYASTVAGDPPQPSASTFTEIEPVEAERDEPFGPKVAQAIGRVFARIRGDG